MIWGYENMSDTCALNKGRSNRNSDLEEVRKQDCASGTWEHWTVEYASCSWSSLEIRTDARSLPYSAVYSLSSLSLPVLPFPPSFSLANTIIMQMFPVRLRVRRSLSFHSLTERKQSRSIGAKQLQNFVPLTAVTYISASTLYVMCIVVFL